VRAALLVYGARNSLQAATTAEQCAYFLWQCHSHCSVLILVLSSIFVLCLVTAVHAALALLAALRASHRSA
jgi:hypothetical protein